MTKYLIDTHCHLDLMENIQRQVSFEDSQLIKTITVTNAPSFFQPNTDLFKRTRNIRVGIGLHPELCSQFSSQLPVFAQQLEMTRYVGEVGLDGSTRYQSSYYLQKEVFENILKATSAAGGKILTVHSRNAANDVVDLLKQHKTNLNNKIILHWFSGNKTALKEAIEMGFYFSVNHKMLQSAKGIEVVKHIPKHLLLTETDAPFTFDSYIKTRRQSLELTNTLMSVHLLEEKGALHLSIYQNFESLLR